MSIYTLKSDILIVLKRRMIESTHNIIASTRNNDEYIATG
jgi:hypothetical protein